LCRIERKVEDKEWTRSMTEESQRRVRREAGGKMVDKEEKE
jgi:hypothetical protein